MTSEEKQKKQLSNHYKTLSEVYLTRYEDLLSPHTDILTAKGILIEMESELIFFTKKQGHNEKSKKSQERISLLSEIMDKFLKVSSTNFQLRIMCNKLLSEIEQIKKSAQAEVEDLRQQNHVLTETLNSIMNGID